MKEGKTCKICSKTFTRRNYLQKHIENIHSKRYTCPTCSRYFAGPTEHSCATQNGRFACYADKNCSLRFANGMSLRLHMRDGHKKIDENLATGAVLKTKKEARNMVKMLCRKINVLSRCFDELKYQLDNMNDFLTTMGYELPSHSKRYRKEELLEQSDMDYDDLDDYIDYVDGELIGEVEETPEEQNVDRREGIEKTEAENVQVITLYPNTESQKTLTAIPQMQVNKTESENNTLISIPNDTSKPLPTIQIPPVARVGSTIISQLPFQIVPIKVNQIVKPSNGKTTAVKPQVKVTTNTSAGEKDTPPPLFLKIQYESETEHFKNDPKITFHFETGPQDRNADEYIVPT